jgi:hypothetical protein
MRYGEIIERALSIFWRHRYLWLLGALGGGEALGGGFGNIGISGQGSGGTVDTGGGQVPDDVSNQFVQWLAGELPLLVSLGVLLLILLVVYFILSCISTGASVRAIAEHDAGRPFGFWPAWRTGRQTFLRILGLRLLGLVVALPAFAAVGGLIALATFSAIAGRSEGVVTAILAAIVVVPALWLLAIVLGLAWTLAARAIVLEQRTVTGALGRGLGLLRQRPGPLVVLWLIALGVGIVCGLAASIGAGLLLLPLLAILAAVYAVAGMEVALTTAAILFFLYIVLIVLVNGAVGAYLTSYWTVAFRRLQADPSQQPLPAQPSPA